MSERLVITFTSNETNTNETLINQSNDETITIDTSIDLIKQAQDIVNQQLTEKIKNSK